MEADRRDTLLSVTLHTVFGLVIGYGSLFLGSLTNVLGLAIVVLILLGSITQKLMKVKRDKKWWFGNGVILYLFLWIVSWIFFFNF